MREIEIIMAELKEQHSFACEDAQCGLNEVNESWDMLKYRIINSIRERWTGNSEMFIRIIEKS